MRNYRERRRAATPRPRKPWKRSVRPARNSGGEGLRCAVLRALRNSPTEAICTLLRQVSTRPISATWNTPKESRHVQALIVVMRFLYEVRMGIKAHDDGSFL